MGLHILFIYQHQHFPINKILKKRFLVIRHEAVLSQIFFSPFISPGILFHMQYFTVKNLHVFDYYESRNVTTVFI